MHFPILTEEALKSKCILAIIEAGACRSAVYEAKREISAKSSLVLLADYSDTDNLLHVGSQRHAFWKAYFESIMVNRMNRMYHSRRLD
jgi:hypothetical protein